MGEGTSGALANTSQMRPCIVKSRNPSAAVLVVLLFGAILLGAGGATCRDASGELGTAEPTASATSSPTATPRPPPTPPTPRAYLSVADIRAFRHCLSESEVVYVRDVENAFALTWNSVQEVRDDLYRVMTVPRTSALTDAQRAGVDALVIVLEAIADYLVALESPIVIRTEGLESLQSAVEDYAAAVSALASAVETSRDASTAPSSGELVHRLYMRWGAAMWNLDMALLKVCDVIEVN